MSPGHTAFYVVAYDIPNDRRRTKVHKILCGFGQWTQFSLFECYLSEKERLTLQAKLDKVLDEAQDRVRFYALCEACLKKVETVGMEQPAEDRVYIV
ncbi:MAG: CRISPR-associated endonuclease Cas2 [Chloroflexota bacterium]